MTCVNRRLRQPGVPTRFCISAWDFTAATPARAGVARSRTPIPCCWRWSAMHTSMRCHLRTLARIRPEAATSIALAVPCLSLLGNTSEIRAFDIWQMLRALNGRCTLPALPLTFQYSRRSNGSNSVTSVCWMRNSRYIRPARLSPLITPLPTSGGHINQEAPFHNGSTALRGRSSCVQCGALRYAFTPRPRMRPSSRCKTEEPWPTRSTLRLRSIRHSISRRNGTRGSPHRRLPAQLPARRHDPLDGYWRDGEPIAATFSFSATVCPRVYESMRDASIAGPIESFPVP